MNKVMTKGRFPQGRFVEACSWQFTLGCSALDSTMDVKYQRSVPPPPCPKKFQDRKIWPDFFAYFQRIIHRHMTKHLPISIQILKRSQLPSLLEQSIGGWPKWVGNCFLAIYRMDFFCDLYQRYTYLWKMRLHLLTNQLANSKIRVHSSIRWWWFKYPLCPTLFGERPQMVSTVRWTISCNETNSGKPYLSPWRVSKSLT